MQKDFHGDLRVGGVFEQLARLVIAMRYQESDLHWSSLTILILIFLLLFFTQSLLGGE